MALKSVANTPNPDLEAAASAECEMQDHLHGIHALACLLQKATEGLDDRHTGIYGTAYIIEQKAQRMLEMIEQA